MPIKAINKVENRKIIHKRQITSCLWREISALINDFYEELQKNGMATFPVVRNPSLVNLVDMILTGDNQRVFC